MAAVAACTGTWVDIRLTGRCQEWVGESTMPPNVDEEALEVEYELLGQGRRVQPGEPVPIHAWAESERSGSVTNSPGENRRLLAPCKSKLDSGLTLAISQAPRRHTKCPDTPKCLKPKLKTKFEKRKEKIISILRPPYFMISVILIIVCIHLSVGVKARAQLEWVPGAWWLEPWRLVSYGLVHASAAHLALNAVVALVVGWALEREQRWWRVACVWAGGVAAGALGAGVLQPAVRVVGASAAVYALLTAHLPNMCLRFGYIPLWWFRPLSVAVLCVSEGCWTVARSGAPAQGGDHVAWSAHTFGAVVGIPLGFLVFSGENHDLFSIRVCRIISLVLLLAGVTAAALHFTLWYDVLPE